jgi:hypothetical protein
MGPLGADGSLMSQAVMAFQKYSGLLAQRPDQATVGALSVARRRRPHDIR